MITFITSYPHTYTFAALRNEIMAPVTPDTRVVTYDDLFAAKALKPGTYVFTDHERLHPLELQLAARYFRQMRRLPGFRVLNDPARVSTRYALLRALARAGLNDFNTYRADDLPKPKRFPVFLRAASDHDGPIGDLIGNQATLDARLSELEAGGIPLAGLLVIEFCSERNKQGAYDKISVFRIGERLTLSGLLIGRHWIVKSPAVEPEFMTPEIVQDQCAAIYENRYAGELRAAFDIAGIDFGRADIGFCAGRLQVYEINTNPTITATNRYVSDAHRAAREVFRKRLGDMLHQIDLPQGAAAIPVELGPLHYDLQVRREAAKALVAARRPHPVMRLARHAGAAQAWEAAGRATRKLGSGISQRLRRAPAT